MYCESEIKMLEIDEQLFKFGTKCEYIYVILQGVVQIDVTNGEENFFLDLLGRESVLGSNFILSENIWNYSATCKSV